MPSDASSRRQFLSQLAAAGVGGAVLAASAAGLCQVLEPRAIANPLGAYPDRDWEKVYRNLHSTDSTFAFLCADPEGHGCLLRAETKNGVVVRVGPTYGYRKAVDQDRRGVGQRWDPRCCQKGLTLPRRQVADRRCKKPMVRRWLLDWAQAGLPRDEKTGRPRGFEPRRGQGDWVPLSWDEAETLIGRVLTDVAQTYGGEVGRQKLAEQGYAGAALDAMDGAGTQVIKVSGVHSTEGVLRSGAAARFAGGLGLLDDRQRSAGAQRARGGRVWQRHDEAVGHRQAAGVPSFDTEACNLEHARLCVAWGLDFVVTEGPDAHWWTGAVARGMQLVTIGSTTTPSAAKAGRAVLIRPGTGAALALGIAREIIASKRFDAGFVTANTDLVHLVRTDAGRKLRAAEVFGQRDPAPPSKTLVLDGAAPAEPAQPGAVLSRERFRGWGELVVWDEGRGEAVAVGRDAVGRSFAGLGITPRLRGTVTVPLADGTQVECRTVFDETWQLLDSTYTARNVEQLTGAPQATIKALAASIAGQEGRVFFALGTGPHRGLHADLEDRAVVLLAALVGAMGRFGGGIGTFGAHRAEVLGGLSQLTDEDPFAAPRPVTEPALERRIWAAESPLLFPDAELEASQNEAPALGRSHVPTPTKVMVSFGASPLDGAPGQYARVLESLSKVELIVASNWWQTAGCEHADLVLPTDSRLERRHVDAVAHGSHPFLCVAPLSKLPRLHDTRSELEIAAGLSRAIGRASRDERHGPYWAAVLLDGSRHALQRVLDGSSAARGYRVAELERLAQEGVPALLMTRTRPRTAGWEQREEDRPWYTRSGRLELFCEEMELIRAGESRIVHREPAEGTLHAPGGLVDGAAAVSKVLSSNHPRAADGYRFVLELAPHRHAGELGGDIDLLALWTGPFGDIHRRDGRSPSVGEAFAELNPADAKALGLRDGDYAFVDAEPPSAEAASRTLLRVRANPGVQRGTCRIAMTAHSASAGTVEAARSGAAAQSEPGGYQAMTRSGGPLGLTRARRKATLTTDSTVGRVPGSHEIREGYRIGASGPSRALSEALVKIQKAEDGGPDGKSKWGPTAAGLVPGAESRLLADQLAGRHATLEE